MRNFQTIIIILLSILTVLLPANVKGQTTSQDIVLSGVDVSSKLVPADSPSTLVPMMLSTAAAAGDMIDVILTNPAVVVSLITPGATEVSAQNAASLGYGWAVETPDPAAPPLALLLDLPGTHVMIRLPAGLQAGAYQVKLNATGVPEDNAVTVVYHCSSPLRVSAAADASNYRPNDPVTLSGITLDGDVPVTGAAVTAAVGQEVRISAQATVGNYTLVSQVPFGTDAVERTYSARLTNAGSAWNFVQAQMLTWPDGVTIADSALVFRDVPASGSVASRDTFKVRVPNGTSFDPTSLTWKVFA